MRHPPVWSTARPSSSAGTICIPDSQSEWSFWMTIAGLFDGPEKVTVPGRAARIASDLKPDGLG